MKKIVEGVTLGDGSKIRVLTRQEARRQQIRVAKGDPSLAEDLKREKADPEDAEIHLHQQMIELVLKAIRLGENELEFLFWVHEFYVAAHIHEDDLERGNSTPSLTRKNALISLSLWLQA